MKYDDEKYEFCEPSDDELRDIEEHLEDLED